MNWSGGDEIRSTNNEVHEPTNKIRFKRTRSEDGGENAKRKGGRTFICLS